MTRGSAEDDRVRDVVGVGLGPFNLGLAALVEGGDLPLDALFFEQKPAFSWHEGMLIEGTSMEVPFLADLVTLADPTNPYSYLNYLADRDRLYEFYFYETFQIPRREYDDYCRWVAESLRGVRFRREVTAVESIEGGPGEANFRVRAVDPETGESTAALARDVVVGVGSRPHVPEGFDGFPDDEVCHTAGYLDRRESLLDADSVVVVGSGQSAAEVVQDLLNRRPEGLRIDWLTRSDGFFPMEYSKLGLQHFAPEYVRYFFGLSQEVSDDLLAGQDLLYKGIDPETSDELYDALYEASVAGDDPDVGMLAATAVLGAERTARGRYRLDCYQRHEGTRFELVADRVVLATGYRRPDPAFLAPVEERIRRDDRGRFRVRERYALEAPDLDGRIFVQNAELHTHGVGAPDLGLGCFRNAVILDRLLDDSPYPVPDDTVFQDFSAERFARKTPGARLLEPEASADD